MRRGRRTHNCKPAINIRLCDEEIALAMELRSEGCSWKIIAYGMGVNDPSSLCRRVKNAEREGMKHYVR
jgi:hypothetical protein